MLLTLNQNQGSGDFCSLGCICLQYSVFHLLGRPFIHMIQCNNHGEIEFRIVGKKLILSDTLCTAYTRVSPLLLESIQSSTYSNLAEWARVSAHSFTNTVCPGSSDPPEEIFNKFASENEVYTIYSLLRYFRLNIIRLQDKIILGQMNSIG